MCSASVIKDPNEGYTEGDRYFYFPGDGDGILHLVDTHEPVDEDYIRDYARNPDNNEYWLFTRYLRLIIKFKKTHKLMLIVSLINVLHVK